MLALDIDGLTKDYLIGFWRPQLEPGPRPTLDCKVGPGRSVRLPGAQRGRQEDRHQAADAAHLFRAAGHGRRFSGSRLATWSVKRRSASWPSTLFYDYLTVEERSTSSGGSSACRRRNARARVAVRCATSTDRQKRRSRCVPTPRGRSSASASPRPFSPARHPHPRRAHVRLDRAAPRHATPHPRAARPRLHGVFSRTSSRTPRRCAVASASSPGGGSSAGGRLSELLGLRAEGLGAGRRPRLGDARLPCCCRRRPSVLSPRWDTIVADTAGNCGPSRLKRPVGR